MYFEFQTGDLLHVIDASAVLLSHSGTLLVLGRCNSRLDGWSQTIVIDESGAIQFFTTWKLENFYKRVSF